MPTNPHERKLYRLHCIETERSPREISTQSRNSIGASIVARFLIVDGFSQPNCEMSIWLTDYV